MARPLRATIDLSAIRHNAGVAREAAPDSKLLAVVKADAYGHGVVPVVQALADLADGFAVASLEEAVAVRGSGILHPLCLLEGVFSPEELPEANALDLDLVVHAEHQIRWLEEAPLPSPVRVWLKLDSGMHRLGFSPGAYRKAWERVRRIEGVSEIVLTTHFAQADETTVEVTRDQMERFASAAGELPGPRSLANSAGVLAWPASHEDWIRPGLMLYGANPLVEETDRTRRLRPAMELVTEILAVQDVEPGEAIGYAGAYVCDHPMRIGIAAAGYGDGYPRHAPTGAPILVAGRRTRLVGRVAMDMIAVDLTDLPETGVGSPVELWGRDLPVREVADAADTLTYELLTRVMPRVPRIAVGPARPASGEASLENTSG